MKSVNDLWDDLGSLPEEEVIHVMTKLFSVYEKKLGADPKNSESLMFFHDLDVAIKQTNSCNLNRR